eukprot:CAMPEP_0114226186 /NCGR_PEP_ID=MMETSP0058-20121206/1098_1 /TAXON_ID=36894 /ORGANISM="Pyramimonas parkeae, CCMP726" /LENGTH=418 /DNA_ID=CAMNT_0001336895 /DNA_START=214 /DNA_END=1470 /DNA_ORIENTATION=+
MAEQGSFWEQDTQATQKESDDDSLHLSPHADQHLHKRYSLDVNALAGHPRPHVEARMSLDQSGGATRRSRPTSRGIPERLLYPRFARVPPLKKKGSSLPNPDEDLDMDDILNEGSCVMDVLTNMPRVRAAQLSHPPSCTNGGAASAAVSSVAYVAEPAAHVRLSALYSTSRNKVLTSLAARMPPPEAANHITKPVRPILGSDGFETYPATDPDDADMLSNSVVPPLSESASEDHQLASECLARTTTRRAGQPRQGPSVEPSENLSSAGRLNSSPEAAGAVHEDLHVNRSQSSDPFTQGMKTTTRACATTSPPLYPRFATSPKCMNEDTHTLYQSSTARVKEFLGEATAEVTADASVQSCASVAGTDADKQRHTPKFLAIPTLYMPSLGYGYEVLGRTCKSVVQSYKRFCGNRTTDPMM